MHDVMLDMLKDGASPWLAVKLEVTRWQWNLFVRLSVTNTTNISIGTLSTDDVCDAYSFICMFHALVSFLSAWSRLETTRQRNG